MIKIAAMALYALNNKKSSAAEQKDGLPSNSVCSIRDSSTTKVILTVNL